MTTSLAPGRTLSQALQATGIPGLTRLLELRPDLADPVPRGLSDLASRATTSTSVARALDGLDAWRLLVTEAVAALADPVSVGEVAGLLDAPVPPVATAVAGLRDRALLWGEDEALHLVRSAREHFGRFPGGLAAPSPRPLEPDEVRRLLAECDQRAVDVLERLLWSPSGTVPGAERTVDVASARTPVEQLLARRLLRPVGPDAVLLPREVAWVLRGGRFAPAPVPVEPPAVEGRHRTAATTDRAAVGAAYGVLHDLEVVIHQVERGAVRLLRNGSVGQRDTAALAAHLGVAPARAALLLEAAVAADLVTGDGPRLAVRSAYDDWVARADLDRWLVVADAWRAAPRLWSGPGALHPLAPEAEQPRVEAVRGLLVDLVAPYGPGFVPDPASLAAALRWRRPGLARVGPHDLGILVDLLWREAGELGLTALGAASALVEVVRTHDDRVRAEVADLFPAPVEQVIVQADLTAVAPGPLPHALATDLRLLADQESRGGGGVFRFSPASVRRAYDAGWSTADVLDFLTRHSSTGVPQPLAYLVEDVARRHGSIHVAPATAVLQVDDESTAAALLARPEAATLGLRRVAPGVLTAAADPYEVAELLRSLGHTPAVTDDEGRTLQRPAPHRVRTGSRPQPRTAPDPATVASALLTEPPPRPVRPAPGPDDQSTAETLLRLAAATSEARPVRLRYRTADGLSAELTATPLDLSDGSVRLVDTGSAQVRSIPLSRIEFASTRLD